MALVLWRRIKPGKGVTEEPLKEVGGWLLDAGGKGGPPERASARLVWRRPSPGRARRQVGGEVREAAGPGLRGHGRQLRTLAFALRQKRSHGSFAPRTNMI